MLTVRIEAMFDVFRGLLFLKFFAFGYLSFNSEFRKKEQTRRKKG